MPLCLPCSCSSLPPASASCLRRSLCSPSKQRRGHPLLFPMSTSSGVLSLQLNSPCFSSRGHMPPPLPLFLAIPRLWPGSSPLTARAVSRRFILPSASFIWDAITGGNSALEASTAVRRGMQLFRQGDVVGSLAEFDRAIELDPRQKSYLWQRGLSLYYLERFEEGAEQFRIDVAANPNDTEESIWCFLCEAQIYGVEQAKRRFLEVGRDSRPFMREAYNLFKDGGDPEKLVSMFLHGGESEFFYASLYAGLYYESQKDPESSKRHIIAACRSLYGESSGDYMASLAKVHCLCRNWVLA